MHLGNAGVAHHADDFAAGGAADDRIINQHHALPFQQMLHRIELQSHAEIAHALLRFDEGAAYVMIADQTKAERDSALIGKAHAGSNSRIGNWHDKVGVHRSFASQLATQGFAALLDRPANDHTVRTRKVYVLEDAA